MIKQLGGSQTKKFAIDYINRNEAMFMLGLLRHTNCSNCTDFYKGCQGSLSLQENAALNDQEYMQRHVKGTEEFLCGKLRNIIALSQAEEQDLNNQFEIDFNKKISLIAKKGDDDKYVLVYDKDEFDSIIKTMEKQMVDKIQRDVDQINKHNASIVQSMHEKICVQEGQIQTMQKQLVDKTKRKMSRNEE